MSLTRQSEPLKHVRQLADNLLTKFNDIDKDRDGFLSKADLASYKQSIKGGWFMLDGKFEQSDASTVAQLEVVAANLGVFGGVSNDEWGRATSGLSRHDLSKLLGQAQSAERPSELLLEMDALLTKHELGVRQLFDEVGKIREFDRNLILTAPNGVGQYPDSTHEIQKTPVEMPNPAYRTKAKLTGC